MIDINLADEVLNRIAPATSIYSPIVDQHAAHQSIQQNNSGGLDAVPQQHHSRWCSADTFPTESCWIFVFENL